MTPEIADDRTQGTEGAQRAIRSVIETDGLSKKFGKTEALTGVGIEVPEGAIYALVGANGAGKTTLIKLLMNILRPSAGSARVLGIDSDSCGARGCIGLDT